MPNQQPVWLPPIAQLNEQLETSGDCASALSPLRVPFTVRASETI
jgi:hypothetical protein